MRPLRVGYAEARAAQALPGLIEIKFALAFCKGNIIKKGDKSTTMLLR